MDPRHATAIAVLSIACLTILGLRGADVATAIAIVASATVGAHAGADAMRSYTSASPGER